jgi:hypothetical protein
MAGIRERLAMYFLSEGRREPIHLTIPKGAYQVVFQDAGATRKATPATPSKRAALEEFWLPHLSSEAGNVLVYTEPLFFRDDKGHYYRAPGVNDMATAERQLSSSLPEFGVGPLRVTYGCLWTGEVQCLLSIIRMFRELGAPLEIRTPRVCSWVELKHTSLILLGNSRTNSILKSLELDFPYVLDGHRIVNRKPEGTERRLYQMSRRGGRALESMTTYALVTRRNGLIPGSVATMIAADHCRAIEGAGYYLTNNERLTALLGRVGLRNAVAPAQFQLVVRVETIDITREIVDVECVAFRVLKNR